MTMSQQLRDEIAQMLRDGAPYIQIARQLRVSTNTAHRTRIALGIPLPPGRTKRTRTELDALVPQVIAMLQGGASVLEIYEATRFSLNEIARLRREHNIPRPKRDTQAAVRRTVDEAFTHHTRPADDGHLLWTGPRSGRGTDLIASGQRHNARAIAFRKHHGRDPQGRLRRSCDEPECIAGAHLTDQIIRADALYDAIFPGATP